MNTFNFSSKKFNLVVSVDEIEKVSDTFTFKNEQGAILSTYLERLLEVLEDLFFGNNAKELNFDKFNSESFEFSINFCNESQILELNKEYRDKDSVTDVLSFSLHGDLRKVGSVFIDEDNSPVLHLGDIFICREVATSQAQKSKISLPIELLELIIHGFLHLCGHDHEISKREENKMYELETKIFEKITEGQEK